jgi:gamma-glutamyl:cysteine ligase YbdK (ATP-grasp superfamily)
MPELPKRPLHAFSGFGIELEYMIVDRDTLSARPLAERLLIDSEGRVRNEIEHGETAWSNELVSHVIELKTNGPAPVLNGLAERFHQDIVAINAALDSLGALLLPTAMHPLFDPETETRLWPHGQKTIYQAYDRIFGCSGHGWSNVQSMHINLPFADDDEFTRLHAAIRVVLPLIPALSAASPLEQGRPAAWLDGRLRYYRDNQRRIPSIAGPVIPEAVRGIEDYRRTILEPMYRDIAPFDPNGELQDDWLNSRGAIARFERQAIEIRIIDLQECPAADLAIAELVVALVQAFYDETFASFAMQQAVPTDHLATLLWSSAFRADQAIIDDSVMLQLLGLKRPTILGEVWHSMLERLESISDPSRRTLVRMIDRGPLARAILDRLGPGPNDASILDCYRDLSRCLADQRLFEP